MVSHWPCTNMSFAPLPVLGTESLLLFSGLLQQNQRLVPDVVAGAADHCSREAERGEIQASATWCVGGQLELHGNLCQEHTQRKIKAGWWFPLARPWPHGTLSKWSLSAAFPVSFLLRNFSCSFYFCKQFLLFVCSCVEVRGKLSCQLSVSTVGSRGWTRLTKLAILSAEPSHQPHFSEFVFLSFLFFFSTCLLSLDIFILSLLTLYYRYHKYFSPYFFFLLIFFVVVGAGKKRT